MATKKLSNDPIITDEVIEEVSKDAKLVIIEEIEAFASQLGSWAETEIKVLLNKLKAHL